MSDKLTDLHFLEKLGEGSLYILNFQIEDALRYGLKADQLIDQKGELAKAWRELENNYETFNKSIVNVREIINRMDVEAPNE